MENINFKDKNNLLDKVRKEWDSEEWIKEFYEFLQGKKIDGIQTPSHCTPKLTEKKAYTVIWYLQEHLRILPSNIERCNNCGELFDSDGEGIYWETKGNHYCGGCDHLVPENYDRGKN